MHSLSTHIDTRLTLYAFVWQKRLKTKQQEIQMTIETRDELHKLASISYSTIEKARNIKRI